MAIPSPQPPLPSPDALSRALWRIYNRPGRPSLWVGGGNLPWDDPAFSERMLREHLDDSHGAASRTDTERARQLAWIKSKVDLPPGSLVLDLTCGPGLYAVALAEDGCTVLGVDFAPASIAYARELATAANVADRCTFVEADVRWFEPEAGRYDAVLLLYGQLAVFPRGEAVALLRMAARALQPGGRLIVELLNQDRVDKKSSTWWYTDDTGLWGDRPFLHLGERFWDESAQVSTERYYILDLASAELSEIVLCDQTYALDEVVHLMHDAGFATVSAYLAWDGVPLYDAEEWVVYVAER